MAQRRSTRETDPISTVHWAAVALGVVTGVVHLYVGWNRGRPSLALAGVGFFAGVGAFLAGYRRRLLYALGTVYVLVQIAVWAVVNAGEYTAIGYVDKTVQILLVLLLLALLRAER